MYELLRAPSSLPALSSLTSLNIACGPFHGSGMQGKNVRSTIFIACTRATDDVEERSKEELGSIRNADFGGVDINRG